MRSSKGIVTGVVLGSVMTMASLGLIGLALGPKEDNNLSERLREAEIDIRVLSNRQQALRDVITNHKEGK